LLSGLTGIPRVAGDPTCTRPPSLTRRGCPAWHVGGGVIAARHPRVQPRRVLSSALSSVLSLCRRGSGPPGEYPRWLRGRQSACFSFCPFNSEPAGMILRACSGWGVLRRRCVCVCVCVFVCCVVCCFVRFVYLVCSLLVCLLLCFFVCCCVLCLCFLCF